MILAILLTLFLGASVFVLVLTWKANVEPKKDGVLDKDEKVSFYREPDDEERADIIPLFASQLGNLDEHVSGAVRYNRSLYYNNDDFIQIKKTVLNKKFPI